MLEVIRSDVREITSKQLSIYRLEDQEYKLAMPLPRRTFKRLITSEKNKKRFRETHIMLCLVSEKRLKKVKVIQIFAVKLYPFLDFIAASIHKYK